MTLARRGLKVTALAALGALPLTFLLTAAFATEACACPPFTGPSLHVRDARVEDGALRFTIAAASPGLAVRDMALEVDGERYAHATSRPAAGEWALWPVAGDDARSAASLVHAGDHARVVLGGVTAPVGVRVLFAGGAWHGVQLDAYVVLALTLEKEK